MGTLRFVAWASMFAIVRWLVSAMPIRLDFQGVEAGGGFKPFPAGEPIEMTIFAINSKVGKTSKEPYLEFEFKAANSNRKAWSNFSLQPQALWRLKGLLIDLGIDGADTDGMFEFEPAEVLGKTVYLVFEEAKMGDNGKLRQNVAAVSAEPVTVSTGGNDGGWG